MFGRSFSRWLPQALWAGALVLSACQSREKHEAQRFLTRVADLQGDVSPKERGQRLQRLADLSPQTQRVKRAQRTCVRGHRALVKAEVEHAAATLELAQATSEPRARVSRAQASQIEAHLRSSDQAIADARDDLHRCQQAVAQLEQRWGS